ncbi:MAG TPA: DUF1080 domain-containing protein [Bryobacteraceae bacterium]|nr:DUF1080 domain-containing protein [Bryobacteraceae bacterium]
MPLIRNWPIIGATLIGAGIGAFAVAQIQNPPTHRHSAIGYTDTPYLPNQPWRVHDINRPRPRMVTPGTCSTDDRPGRAPSDAVVLFDGKDLSQWEQQPKQGGPVAPRWKVENGYMEIVPRTGDLVSKEQFGDAQFHIEWASPEKVDGDSQWRGNSGVLIMGRYEIQVLDSWNNVTYADGQAAAIYGQWPPMVNASRKPGEWQTYDIAWEAPRFENGKLVKPAYVTVFHNGILVHHHQELIGDTPHRKVGTYTPHGDGPLRLQDHDTPVRYRNIWVRRITGYDKS